MSNKVEITSKGNFTGPYDIKINGVSLPDVLEVDFSNIVSNDGRYLTVSFFVKELLIKKEE